MSRHKTNFIIKVQFDWIFPEKLMIKSTTIPWVNPDVYEPRDN